MSRKRHGRGNSTRRDFVKGVGATAMLLGSPLSLPRGLFAASRGAAGTEERTLFFNFSHIQGAQTATHFLYHAGRKYRLTRVQDAPDVLALERRHNPFLSLVPDSQVTHHVPGVLIPLDMVSMAYTTANENAAAGTWAMTAVFFLTPKSAMAHAYARARELTPTGPLPLSGKRKRYSVRAALTEQDLHDEIPLVDISSHAEALVGLHPDVLCLEPNGGAHIQVNYVSPDSNTQFLALQLQGMGPAVPQGAPNMGATPWATLVPILDDTTGKPFKMKDGNLNQYYPDWDPSIDPLTASGVGNIHPLVKNDESLGVDVTGYNQNDPNNPFPPEKMAGKVWARHDGIPSVAALPSGFGDSGPTVAFKEQIAEIGLRTWDPDHTVLGDGRVQVTLDNASNWYLRWLGMWAQFFDANGTVIQAKALPNDTYPAGPGPYPRNTDVDDAIFLGVVPNANAILGIPALPGKFAPTLNIPLSAATMRILYTGIGQAGKRPADPTGVYGAGIAMTVAFNYALVGLFMAAGVSDFGDTVKFAISLGGGALAQEIQVILGSQINDESFFKSLERFALGFAKILLQTGLTPLLGKLAAYLAAKAYAAQLIDSVPLAGQIARALAAAVGALQLAETYIEVAVSPAAYVFDIVKTHDLSIRILPATTNTQFPQPPPGYTLYYKVSYLFDNGTAHVRDAVDVLDPTVTPIKITFPGVPSGGMVNISIGFYMRQSRTPPGQNDWCAGFGTTGLVDNTADQAPDLTITENPIPIQPTTKYLHTRKTALDAQGSHYWLGTSVAPPYTAPPGGLTPGLGGFNAITVRQGTSNPPQDGYVGYVWNAYSSGVSGCGVGSSGLYDQAANLNTDAGNNGTNAQKGYATTACGFQAGVRIGYNLLTHKVANIYLDTTSLMVRPVFLDPPGFAGPSSNQSFGQLNFDSDRCLLHPAGHIVSISFAKSKIEVLKLPRKQGQVAVVTDAEAQSFFLARTLSGVGKRPGLITSPAAVTITPDGAILVLEAGYNRIQAFDLGGNPVPLFKAQPRPYFLQLDASNGNTYLDVAVEFTGYIYVLSKDTANNHRLDIYHPTQANTDPICTTEGVNAAKLAVNFQRQVYTLNYEVLRLPNGNIPGFTEPSVSLWVPTPPNTNLNRRSPRSRAFRK